MVLKHFVTIVFNDMIIEVLYIMFYFYFRLFLKIDS